MPVVKPEVPAPENGDTLINGRIFLKNGSKNTRLLEKISNRSGKKIYRKLSIFSV
jgi:hypothetical protein